MDYQKIKKVHVVYKTHLDIGFTDMGRNVLDRYVKEYIPHSVRLAEEMNGGKEKRFIWTVGSYLIDYYLKHADAKALSELEAAIERGDICWHGIASTTHTELLDMDLFQYGLELGSRLDSRYKRHTIAAKMTDVPGHTIAVVDALADKGIRFLHIGVNASSMVPEIPQTFVWRHGTKQIIVQYSSQYGAPGDVEGMDEVLEFAHTGDNLGPQSAEEVEAEYERIRKLYPNAVVEASTLDAYAESLLAVEETLPVIEEEIGDTWIHGIGSDPWKVSRYRELIRLKDQWQREGRFSRDCEGYDAFMMNLMLIAEHTWGLDYKKYLADFKNWTKEDFQKARAADETTLEFLTNRNAQMREVLDIDFKRYRGGVFTGSYRYYESSHEEQREYLKKALEELPADLKAEAERALTGCIPVKEESEGRRVCVGEILEIGGWKAAVDGSGAIRKLERGGRDWAKDGAIGRLGYETFNALNCVQNYYRYNRAFYENGYWSEGDFSKPGLEFVEDLENRYYEFSVRDLRVCGEELLIDLAGDAEAAEKYGCPQAAQIKYVFGPQITCSVSWFGKDANRMPEALWFDFIPDTENPNRWLMEKMGVPVSPLNVLRGGNRLQHCVERLVYDGSDGKMAIETVHAPLVSAGGRNLYDDYRRLPDLRKGFSFNLFNNKWGTNFCMWCEDDCRFEFKLDISEKR